MKICAIQLSPGPDVTANVDKVIELITSAASKDARFIALPEYFAYYGPEENWVDVADMGQDIADTLSQVANELSIYLLTGCILMPADDGRCINISTLFGPDGSKVESYEKIHLFDVSLESGEYCESKWLKPGNSVIAAEMEGWRLGFSICFDLRFPDHYQKLRRMGANLVAIPSAFSKQTGMAHWMTLLKARAIETQCYVIAPALTGEFDGGRKCYGHSAIIDPWGRVMATLENGVGAIWADMDKELVDSVRSKMPLGFDNQY
jgi:nitrilase